MGNTESSNIKELNSGEIMSMKDKNWLIKEFEKEKNEKGQMSDNEKFISFEKVEDGKKHYYFNVSAFFDPDKGFLRCFIDIYKRYKEIKKVEEIMPFACLILRPLDEIVKTLKIKPGSYLDYSLAILYSIGFSLCVTGLTVLLASRIHPVAGIAFYAGVCIRMLYEDYKGTKELGKINKLEKEDEMLISRIFNLFSSVIGDKICEANVIEIIIDEQYKFLLQALVNEFLKKTKYEEKVKIKLWYIPEINKAKKLKDFSEMHQTFISGIIEEMKKCKDDKSFYENYRKFSDKYRETYKKVEAQKEKMRELERKYEDCKNKENEICKLYEQIDKIKANDPDDPRIDEIYQKIRDLCSQK